MTNKDAAAYFSSLPPGEIACIQIIDGDAITITTKELDLPTEIDFNMFAKYGDIQACEIERMSKIPSIYFKY